MSDSVLERVLARARSSPDAVAVDTGTGTWSFDRLARAAGALARGLDEAGVRAGDVVGVRYPAGPRALALLLALLARRAVFTWLDPAAPAARQIEVLDDCAAVALIVDAADAESEVAVRARDRGTGTLALSRDGLSGTLTRRGGHRTPPEGTACVLYTSGSEGRPKGILQSERNILQFVDWVAEALRIGPGARVLRWASFAYDAVFAEVLAAPVAGATVVMPDYRRDDPAATLAVLDRHAVTHLQCVPSFARQLMALIRAGGTAPRDLRVLSLAGETLDVGLARSVRASIPTADLVNLYGPTECILATWHVVRPEDLAAGRVPVGRAIPGRRVVVAGEDGRPRAPGEPGEILVEGDHLALGYLRTAGEDRFGRRADGTRVLRTGDLGVVRPDGLLDFLGRADRQVKVRGNRVEPAEIEELLLAEPAVRGVVVTAETVGEETVLVAHVVAPGASAADLRARIARRLPPSMVPHEIRLVDRIPRLVSGKVDRRAMERPRPSADAGGAADGDPVRVLADAWCEVLNRPAPPEGDFFDLGGDSLSAAKLIVRVAEGLGVELPMEAVLDHPEFDAMAGYLRDAVTARNHVVPPTHS